MAFGRRSFLGSALAGAAAVRRARAAAGAAPPPGARRHALPDAPRPPAQSTVAVVRTAAFGTLREALAEAVRLAGGLAFVRPGDRVLLKPAVNSGNRYPATTDAEVVALVAAMVREAGGHPLVADRTMFLRSTRTAFERTGILEAARAAGMPCLALDGAEEVTIEHPLAAHWSGARVRVYRAVAEADHVVDLCTPRTHALAGFTMGLKNLVGVVAGSARPGMHLGAGFVPRVAEIAAVVRPALTLLDGRLGFADGGPDEGDLVRPGLVAASTDPLALDALGVAALRLAGTNDAIGRGPVWSLPLLRRAAEIGVGVAEGARIRIAGLAAADEVALRARLG
ncbi:DUF362 domain-containing protein [Anaeromyxobacter sp. Red801]|uniref:DUF362 domain-containing protein n=1 Tax=Anaeromyxobacter sp. Red801 TaxID=3411632 RepID=UPI003BA11CC0